MGGCASHPVAPPAEASEIPLQNMPEIVGTAPAQALQSPEAQAQYHVMAGEMAAARDEPGLAAREFLAALTYIPDVELARRTATLAVAARDEALSLEAARRWLELEPASADPREVIASLSLERGDLNETLVQCRALANGHPGGLSDGLLHCAQLLVQANAEHGDGALTVMQQLVAESPDLAGAHHALAIVALRYERLELAGAAVRRARELAPGNRDHDLLEIGIWVQSGEVEQANARMAELVAADPKAVELRVGYAKLLLDNQQRDAARSQLKKVLDIDPGNADANYALGVLSFNDGDHAAAERHFTRLLVGPRAQDAALQMARIAEARGRYDEALDFYTRVRVGPAALEAAMRSASVLARTDRIESAQMLMRELRDRFPQLETRLDLAEGEMLIQSGDAAGALALYDEALAEDDSHPDLRYGRSLAYEQLGQIDKAEEDLRRILADAPEDARALNALGYMLTVHTDRYDEAELMIAQALELQPDDPAIMDSMGWLHFKRGRVQEALTLLRDAHTRYPDPEVAAHLGEVLWTLGEQDEARSVWNAALAKDPDHPVLLETTQRLNP